METWKTIFQSQFLDAKKPVCEHYAHNWLFSLLSTFPLSFFFRHFSARKNPIFKREWKRGKHFQSQFWFIQKLVCEHYAHNWFFHCCKKYFGKLKIGQEKNVQFRKSENSFVKKMHFFICEQHAKKIFHWKKFCYWKK